MPGPVLGRFWGCGSDRDLALAPVLKVLSGRK